MRKVLLASWLTLGFGVMQACSAPDEAVILECDPNALFPGPECLDAGTDAASTTDDKDGGAEGGISSASQTCAGRCVPEPSSDSAGDWPRTPVLLWVGPPSEMPATCNEAADGATPDKVFFEKYRRYSGLVAPPAKCEPCTCEPAAGTCDELPASIEIRTNACNQSGGEVVPFDGPAGWDGSCTNENALPAGTMCNGEPCAQYVGVSALPGPKHEACAPTSETPPFTKEKPSWLLGGLACEIEEQPGACKPEGYRCMMDRPFPWLQCVARSGVHEQCPGNYTAARYVMYDEAAIEGRGCETCKCGAPQGGYCGAFLHLYDDDACGMESTKLTLASIDVSCGTLMPPGRSLGSKTISDLSYVPGYCAASGGAPIGEAQKNMDTAVTFCCLAPFDIPS